MSDEDAAELNALASETLQDAFMRPLKKGEERPIVDVSQIDFSKLMTPAKLAELASNQADEN